MSAFDFAVTVAIGSVLASAWTTPANTVLVPFVGIAALFGVQMILAPLRARLNPVERAIDNRPLLVMENGAVLYENLVSANMTRADLLAKLRAANVHRFSDVRWVVVESTGDVSVLHGPAKDAEPSEILEDVRR